MASSTRLYVLLARYAPVGVIFRRGPSKHVLMIRWNLENDTFVYGQWLKGRVYDKRSDLSPEGDMLLYFAGNYREPYRTWSAVSRPPFFTALALWPKGDAWGGGGLFEGRNRLALNHRHEETALAPDFKLPKWMSVTQFGKYSGRGEDDPIWSTRLQRDGWKLTRYPEKSKDDHGRKVWYEFDPPITWQKPNPKFPQYALEMAIVGIKKQDGPWYLIDHSIVRQGERQNVGRSDWADWSPEGDLLFAQSGCLYRLKCKKGKLSQIEESRQLADFSQLKFEPKEPTREVLQWPRR